MVHIWYRTGTKKYLYRLLIECGIHKEYVLEVELIRKAKDGNPKALNTIVKKYEPLIRKLASKFSASHLERDDLIQEARLGFLIGLKSFDCDLRDDEGKPYSLGPWVKPWILKYLASATNSDLIKEPERWPKLRKKIEAGDLEDVTAGQLAAVQPRPTYAAADVLEDVTDALEGPLESLLAQESGESWRKLLEGLSEQLTAQERTHLRYWLRDLSAASAGALGRITAHRVRQIRSSIRSKLTEAYEGPQEVLEVAS